MKTKTLMPHYSHRLILIAALGFLLPHCGGGGSDSEEKVALNIQMKEAQKFNPNAEHGKIDKFKVIITGEGIETPMVKEYPYGTDKAVLEGVPHKSKVQVEVQAINVNGLVVRRGISEEVLVRGKKSNAVPITIHNVPIFTNVKDGGEVAADRFVPRVFAPGEIQFQVSSLFNGTETVLEDMINNQVLFSVGEAMTDSVMSIHPPQLTPGVHDLTVEDPESGESTTITVTVLPPGKKKVLTTTAGAYLGTPVTRHQKLEKRSDIIQALDRLTD